MLMRIMTRMITVNNGLGAVINVNEDQDQDDNSKQWPGSCH